MTDSEKGMSRRRFLGGLAVKTVDSNPAISKTFDRIAPETSQGIKRLGELREQAGVIPITAMTQAIGDVFSLLPTNYHIDRLAVGIYETTASYTLPFGDTELFMAHGYIDEYGHAYQEANVRFFPDTSGEVIFFLDDIDENTGRLDRGIIKRVESEYMLTVQETDEFADMIGESGVSDDDRRLILRAIEEAVLPDETSETVEEITAALSGSRIRSFGHAWTKENCPERVRRFVPELDPNFYINRLIDHPSQAYARTVVSLTRRGVGQTLFEQGRRAVGEIFSK